MDSIVSPPSHPHFLSKQTRRGSISKTGKKKATRHLLKTQPIAGLLVFILILDFFIFNIFFFFFLFFFDVDEKV
jgi:hypothetical protein